MYICLSIRMEILDIICWHDYQTDVRFSFSKSALTGQFGICERWLHAVIGNLSLGIFSLTEGSVMHYYSRFRRKYGTIFWRD